MGRWKGKPFGYLEGMEAADDAPVMDNPGRLFCRTCRAQGVLVCGEPGFCGNLEPMKPLPTPPDAIEQDQPTQPQPLPLLDDSEGRQRLIEVAERPRTRTIPDFGGRLLGNKAELKPLPDGVEQSWDWFMEQVTPEEWPR